MVGWLNVDGGGPFDGDEDAGDDGDDDDDGDDGDDDAQAEI